MKMLALGPKGTNGHEAAKKASSSAIGLFNRRAICFAKKHHEILSKVAMSDGEIEGIVAIENTIVSHVQEVIDFWLKSPLRDRVRVIREVSLPIHHQLLAHPSVEDISQITSVISHIHALGQTEKSLDKFPHITERRPVDSTGLAAQEVATGKVPPSTAAIASPFAQRVYGLRVLIPRIEDVPNNETRFHIVGKETPAPTRHDRTAILCIVNNARFALRGVVNAINTDISSIKIPITIDGSRERCGLYLEFDEHAETMEGKKIMRNIRSVVESVFVLGSFPKERGR